MGERGEIEIQVIKPIEFTEEDLHRISAMYELGFAGWAFIQEMTIEEARVRWPSSATEV